MREAIQRWHVGQLIMAWIGGTIFVGALAIPAVLTEGARSSRAYDVKQRADARAALTRDSIVRVDTVALKALSDSFLAVWNKDGQYEAESFANARGALLKEDKKAKRALLAEPPMGSPTPFVGLLVFEGLVALAIPLTLFWATWVWFGARTERPAPLHAPAPPRRVEPPPAQVVERQEAEHVSDSHAAPYTMGIKTSSTRTGGNTMPEAASSKKSWFAKIESREDALRVVKETSGAFYVLAGLTAVLSPVVGYAVLWDAAIYAACAFFLRRSNSRAAAIILLVVALLSAGTTVANKLGQNLGGGNNIFLAIIVVGAAIRAVDATFKLRGRFAAVPTTPA